MLRFRGWLLKKYGGFTLLEVAIAIGLIAVATSVFLGIWFLSIAGKRSEHLIVASHIASREIEHIRQTNFDLLPASGPFSDPMLAELPSGAAFVSVENYEGVSDMKHVSVTVSWSDGGATKNYKLDTIVARGATYPPQ